MNIRVSKIPELQEGRLFKLNLNGEKKYITFEKKENPTCKGCLFEKETLSFCWGAKCNPSCRKDGSKGIFVEVKRGQK